MSSAWSQLEQMLTCAICLDKFKNPRLLPCQHSFCGDACMDGLVDYARRQIKCPECRAEHRIPYQGVQSLPLNVTLIRFLELHARITGEEMEPVPTFMEKCSICGEKVEGVKRCAHCDKKVCPECGEAHLDLLKREIARINGQSKRCLGKLREFGEVTLKRADEKLSLNHESVRSEIEQSCKRLISDLEAKQKRLLEEADSYVERERKTLEKLKTAFADECSILESNLELADEKLLPNNAYQWQDFELNEMKEIYNKAMEFVRLFDPEIGDFTRKVRFTLVPEFDVLRKRLCELGELKFSETAQSLIANSFQYCNASGAVALEISQQAAITTQQQQQQQQYLQQTQQSQQGGGLYGLAHSNSNTNLNPLDPLGRNGQVSIGGVGGGISSSSGMLELPNALMRSQSDHRLASQFQARLKQQQQQQQEGGRYGIGARGGVGADYETDSLRSRYAPPRSTGAGVGGKSDYSSSDLLRDWPRPSDNDSADATPFGSSIHFKSAFMRRKEKERQQHHSAYSYAAGAGGTGDDDDDLTSEASYGGSSRNVRFYDQLTLDQQAASGKQPAGANAVKMLDCREVEHAPLSGVPKLIECPQLNTRLHQLGAKAIVDKRHAEEEGRRDKDLVDSARQAMSRASELRIRKLSEDEIEKQKQANKQLDQTTRRCEDAVGQQTASDSPLNRSSGTPAQAIGTTATNQSVSAPTADTSSATTATGGGGSSPASSSPATPTSAASLPGGRRSLYGLAVTERSKRQLSSAIRDAEDYSARRRSLASSRDDEVDSAPERPTTRSQAMTDSPSANSTASTPQTTAVGTIGSTMDSGSIRRRALRSGASGSSSGAKSMSRRSMSVEQHPTECLSSPSTTSARRRRLLARGDSSLSQQGSQQQLAGDEDDRPSTPTRATRQANPATSVPKNSPLGSGGASPGSASAELPAKVRPRSRAAASRQSTMATATTDEEGDEEENEADAEDYSASTGTVRRVSRHASSVASPTVASRLGKYASSQVASYDEVDNDVGVNAEGDDDNDDEDDDDDDEENGDVDGDDDDDYRNGAATGSDENVDSGLVPKRNSGNRRSREFLPTYVNKLLDRSAQIRRDSQEQRSRTNSPPPPRAGDYASAASSSGTSSSSAAALRQRLAYGQRSSQQKSLASSQADCEETTTSTGKDSNTSIYTTASSQRRSSAEDEHSFGSTTGSSTLASRRRRPSTTSSSTTTTATTERTTRNNEFDDYTRRDSTGSSASRYAAHSGSGDASTGGFQSRFLARSRTSAALSSGGSTRSSLNDSLADYHSSSAAATSGRELESISGQDYSRSYLSSRDRFMQSASGLAQASSSPAGQAAGSSSAAAAALGGSSSSYTRGAASAAAAASSAGFKIRSEYLRDKFARSGSGESNNNSVASASSSSSASAFRALGRSKSSHGFSKRHLRHNGSSEAAGSSPPPDDSEHDGGLTSDQEAGSRKGSLTTGSSRRGPSRRGSSGTSSFERPVAGGTASLSSASLATKSCYASKGRLLFKLGTRGSDAGNFTWPRGVTVGGSGGACPEIVVADSSNHRVQVFDLRGRFLHQFGTYGSAPGQFDCLAGVAFNKREANYIVSDRYNHRVQVFDKSGRFVRAFGELGREQGQFNLPWGVACDSSGSIYVCDKENHRVQVFAADGTYLTRFGSLGSQAGQLQHPHYIAISSLNASPGGCRIVVTDTNNHRVQVFDLSGRLVNTFGREGSAQGEFKFPRGVAVDEQNFIIVGDSGNNRLQIFSAEGQFVRAIGTWGSGEAEFKGIEGVAVDSVSSQIFVCDRENHRIQVF